MAAARPMKALVPAGAEPAEEADVVDVLLGPVPVLEAVRVLAGVLAGVPGKVTPYKKKVYLQIQVEKK